MDTHLVLHKLIYRAKLRYISKIRPSRTTITSEVELQTKEQKREKRATIEEAETKLLASVS